MNYYQLQNFFDYQLHNCVEMQAGYSAHHCALFTRICAVQNRVGWSIKVFGLPTDDTMFLAGIGSYNTYKKCIADLVSWGIILEVVPATNQYQSRKVSLYTPKWASYFDESLTKQVQSSKKWTEENDESLTKQNEDSINGLHNLTDQRQSTDEAHLVYKTIETIETIKQASHASLVSNYLKVENLEKALQAPHTGGVGAAPCTIAEIQEYFTSITKINGSVSQNFAREFYERYQAAGWRAGKQNDKIKDWKKLALGWINKGSYELNQLNKIKPAEPTQRKGFGRLG